MSKPGSLPAFVALGALLLACGDAPSPQPATSVQKPETTTPPAPVPSGEGDTRSQAAQAEPAAMSQAELIAQGRSVWMGNCIACHNPDPSLDGALGPAVVNSSRALLEARVVRAAYPEGYQPKRDTKIMIALPHLADEIPALEAFLARD